MENKFQNIRKLLPDFVLWGEIKLETGKAELSSSEGFDYYLPDDDLMPRGKRNQKRDTGAEFAPLQQRPEEFAAPCKWTDNFCNTRRNFGSIHTQSKASEENSNLG